MLARDEHSRLLRTFVNYGCKKVFFNLSQVILKSGNESDHVIIRVTANNGVAASWGIHHYLKYFCQIHISWDVDQLGKLFSIDRQTSLNLRHDVQKCY